ncbi:MAG TPA: hypothetical protein VFT84_13090 [Gemmatimonadales bacterium]|nr:hypothetical protein [Gemmatimonadales bacterium]
MDFGGLLLLGLLWVVFNVLTRRKPDGTGASRTRPPLPGARPPATGDATQQEGSRLEVLLRELERALDQGPTPSAGKPRQPSTSPQKVAGRLGRPADAPLPRAEEVEERESLEVDPEVESLERDVARPARPHLSQDDAADRLVAGRIAAAEARSGPITRAEHLAFDQRIRSQPADATAVRMPTAEQLRRAVVWREVLGPPVSLRKE